MLRKMGLDVAEADEPFEPEGGAYSGHDHGHDHSHGHAH
jgi:urease accessory protein